MNGHGEQTSVCLKCDRNPYAASQIADPSPPSAIDASATGLARWRLYLLIHLGMVAFIVVMYVLTHSSWREHLHRILSVEPINRAFDTITMLSIVHNVYVAPVLAIVLFVKGYKRDRRYIVAGVIELLLIGAFFFALIPMVQC